MLRLCGREAWCNFFPRRIGWTFRIGNIHSQSVQVRRAPHADSWLGIMLWLSSFQRALHFLQWYIRQRYDLAWEKYEGHNHHRQLTKLLSLPAWKCSANSLMVWWSWRLVSIRVYSNAQRDKHGRWCQTFSHGGCKRQRNRYSESDASAQSIQRLIDFKRT